MCLRACISAVSKAKRNAEHEQDRERGRERDRDTWLQSARMCTCSITRGWSVTISIHGFVPNQSFGTAHIFHCEDASMRNWVLAQSRRKVHVNGARMQW